MKLFIKQLPTCWATYTQQTKKVCKKFGLTLGNWCIIDLILSVWYIHRVCNFQKILDLPSSYQAVVFETEIILIKYGPFYEHIMAHIIWFHGRSYQVRETSVVSSVLFIITWSKISRGFICWCQLSHFVKSNLHKVSCYIKCQQKSRFGQATSCRYSSHFCL